MHYRCQNVSVEIGPEQKRQLYGKCHVIVHIQEKGTHSKTPSFAKRTLFSPKEWSTLSQRKLERNSLKPVFLKLLKRMVQNGEPSLPSGLCFSKYFQVPAALWEISRGNMMVWKEYTDFGIREAGA